MGHLPKTQTQLYSDMQAKNSPYGNILAPGDASGLNVNGYLMSRFGLNGVPTSKKGDKYYIAVDANNKLRSGIQVNGADKITWKEIATKDDLLSIDIKKYASGALSKGSQKEINLTFEPRTGYTRRYFVGELFGTGSNSVIVNVHGSTLSFFAINADADITATILCIYTKD